MNNSGYLKVVEAAIDENVSMQQKSASDFNDLKGEVKTNFATLYNINKATGGLNGLQNTTAQIADGVERISFINRKHLENFVEIDRQLATKIDQLEMSHDFVGNNSLATNTYNTTILGKIDGKSVNVGAEVTNKQTYDDRSSVSKMQTLTDITTGATVEQHAKDINGVNAVVLGNVANSNANDEQHAQEIQGVRNLSLGDVSNESSTVEQHAQEIQGVNGISLGSLNNGNNTVEQHIQEIQGINGVSLTGINNGNDTVKMGINDNYSVEGQVSFGSLNSNNSVPKAEFDNSRL